MNTANVYIRRNNKNTEQQKITKFYRTFIRYFWSFSRNAAQILGEVVELARVCQCGFVVRADMGGIRYGLLYDLMMLMLSDFATRQPILTLFQK